MGVGRPGWTTSSGLLKPVMLIVVLFAVRGAGGCNSTNIHETPEGKQACVTCHLVAYNSVKSPIHVGVFPQTCGDCHTTTAWRPTIGNAGGHIEALFPITAAFAGETLGGHSNAAIGCADCHIATLGSATAGANTDCIHCHLGDHSTPSIDAQPYHSPNLVYSYQKSTTPNIAPNYCLTCHPDGGPAKSPGDHPNAKFDIDPNTSWHGQAGIGCLDCHNPALGPSKKGANCDCVHCHLGSHIQPAIDQDPSHIALGAAYTTIPSGYTATNFCLGCHANGNAASAGHPEALFPITTGWHKNAAVACGDCHIASLGSSAGGKNTDCIHCHIGAHTTPSIDTSPKHLACPGQCAAKTYTPTTTTGYNPNTACRSCHPNGLAAPLL